MFSSTSKLDTYNVQSEKLEKERKMLTFESNQIKSKNENM